MKQNQLVRKFALIALLNCFSIAAAASFNPFIVHGRPVKLGENYSKYTVGLGQSEIMCSGVIIDKNHIVTAAHCNDEVSHGKVYFGTDKTNFVFRTVIGSTLHPEYCKNGNCGTLGSQDDNDILILKFEGDLPEGFEAVPVATKASLISKVSIHLAGFGANEHGNYEDILKVAQAPFAEFNGQSEFRTDETLAGSCNGDSGGPAFVSIDGQLQLAGITSRGDGPCRKLGIYTMVSYFSKWISEVAAH